LYSIDRRRALRVPFVAATTFTAVAAGESQSTRTTDLSVNGCFVTTANAPNPGTNLWVTLVFAGVKFSALAKVVHVREEGMGIAFPKIEMRDRSNVDRWMSLQGPLQSERPSTSQFGHH
jgi:c-di-GMP-binding flagellar brake protein YcgR